MFKKILNFIKRSLKYVLLFIVLILSTLAFIIVVKGNFYTVSDNVYRSGQLNSYNFEYYVEKYKIKTIINLRGKSKKPWYANEKSLSKEFNITHIDYGLSNRKFYDYNKTSDIVTLLKNVQKPLLIHCAGGADRTSLVSALYEYGINNKTYDESKKQLSWYYGHLPMLEHFKNVIQMDKSFDNYVSKQNK